MDVRNLIPGYEIIDVISDTSGQSIVYRARQLSVDNRWVAIKVYRRPLRTEEDRQGFLREVEALRDLDGHPNVVRMDKADIAEGGRAYIVMDLCQRSLGDELRDEGLLPAQRVAEIGRRVAGALAAAHARGILHRDLKPANLLRTPFGGVAVADFGIAALASGPGGSPTSGTPGYIAPETRAGHRPSVRSDVFSLGATLFTLLHGSAPAPGQRVGGAQVPGWLADVISVALADDPADRFSDMRAFAQALTSAGGRATGPATVTDGVTTGDRSNGVEQPASTATLTAPDSDDLAEPWLRGVDTRRTPQPRPAITIRPTPAIVSQVGWAAAGVAAVLCTVLVWAVFGGDRLVYALAWAAATLGGHALSRTRSPSARALAAVVLSCQEGILIGGALYLAVREGTWRDETVWLAGATCLALVAAQAASKTGRWYARRAERGRERLTEAHAMAELADRLFTGSGRAPEWLTRLLGLPAIRLYRPAAGPFEYLAACGSNVAAFTVVHWHRGQYSTRGSAPHVARNGQPYRQGGTDMASAIDGLSWLGQRLGSARGIMALVVVTGADETGDGVVTAPGEPTRGLVLATPQTVTSVAGAFLARDPYHLDTALTERLLRLARR